MKSLKFSARLLFFIFLVPLHFTSKLDLYRTHTTAFYVLVECLFSVLLWKLFKIWPTFCLPTFRLLKGFFFTFSMFQTTFLLIKEDWGELWRLFILNLQPCNVNSFLPIFWNGSCVSVKYPYYPMLSVWSRENSTQCARP